MGAGRPDYSFSKAHRLASSREYRRVYRSTWRGRCGPLSWHARANHDTTARLGLAVPKRVIKRATDRSRIKRVIRESFRLNRSRLPPVDIVVSVKALPRDLYEPACVHRVDEIWRQLLASAAGER